MTKCLLITLDLHWSVRIRALLSHLEDDDFYVTDRIAGATFADTIEVLDETDPAVVIIGPDIDSGTALGLTRAIDERLPSTSVVLVADPQPALLERAVRAGVRDVLDPFAEREDMRVSLVDTLERAMRRRNGQRSHEADAPDPARSILAAGFDARADPHRPTADAPAHGRVVRRLFDAVAKCARRFTPAGIVEGLERRTDRAGVSDCWPPDRVLAMKLTGGVLGGVFGLLFYFANPSAQSFILFAIVAGIGFVAPDVWIAARADARRKQIERVFADRLDQISLKSNSGFRSRRLSVTGASPRLQTAQVRACKSSILTRRPRV
jgi:hypothetical protein